jgi:4,5-dihydroxyphthalate decarboxylase
MSEPLVLKTALATAPYTAALKDGRIESNRVRLAFENVPRIQDAFPKMVREQTYDVCQMSPTTYLVAKSFGKPVTALPVFLNRHFHHGYIIGNTGAGVREPRDLEGKRLGIGSWTITTGVWGRMIMQTEFGVDLDRITWVSFEDPHVAEYKEPATVTRATGGKTLNGMLSAGELDGAVAAGVNETSDVRPLVRDLRKTEEDWYRRTGIYPIVHTVVVRDELLGEHPWLASELFRMFEAAKDLYVRALDDERLVWQSQVLGGDPLPYGVGPNRRSLDALIETAVSQGIIPAPMDPEGLFAGV